MRRRLPPRSIRTASAHAPTAPPQPEAAPVRKSARNSNSKHVSSKHRWGAMMDVTAEISAAEMRDAETSDQPPQQQDQSQERKLA